MTSFLGPKAVSAVATAMVVLGCCALAEAARPKLRPNSQRYRQKNKPALARAGDAVIETRALLSRRLGTTLFEATTGKLDGAPGTATIERLTLSLEDRRGRTVWRDRNRNVDAPTFSETYANFRRGQLITVEGQVRPAGARRNFPVRANPQVLYRPDLAVTEIAMAAQAHPGNAVNILATIRELNGDVGATTDCLLSVDGALVDRGAAIWVDGGDAVSCSFTTIFSAIGTRAVKVSLSGTRPMDDVATNDEASRTIQVVGAGERIPHSAYVSTRTTKVRDTSQGYYNLPAGEHYDWNYTRNEETWTDTVVIAFEMTTRFALPLTLMTITEAAAEATPTLTFQAANWAGEAFVQGAKAASRFVHVDETTGVQLYMESGFVGADAYTSGNYTRSANGIVYFTEGHERHWFDGDPDTQGYTVFPSFSAAVGSHLITMNQHTINITIQDAATTWIVNPTVPLVVAPIIEFDPPLSCFPEPIGQTCAKSYYYEMNATGSLPMQ